MNSTAPASQAPVKQRQSCWPENIQPYTLSCIAVEPSEAIEVKLASEEKVDEALKHTNRWIKLVKFGTEVVDPSSLLKITKQWL